jgi:hypothetical protein
MRRCRRTDACKRRGRRFPAGWSTRTLHDLPPVPFPATLRLPRRHRLHQISEEIYKA